MSLMIVSSESAESWPRQVVLLAWVTWSEAGDHAARRLGVDFMAHVGEKRALARLAASGRLLLLNRLVAINKAALARSTS